MTYIKIIKKSEYDSRFGKPNQEEVWDEIAETWSEYRNKTLPVVEEFLKDKKGKVIDLGCGSGRNMIASNNIEYYGVDFSEKQLESAEKMIKDKKINAKFFKSRADKLDKNIFKDNMFDYGLFIATLHCIEGKENKKRAIEEFYRVLKKSAEGLISVWNSEDKRFDCVGNKGDIYMSWKINGKENMRYYYLFQKNEFIELINSIGFKIIEFYDSNNPEGDRFSKKNWIVRVRKQLLKFDNI